MCQNHVARMRDALLAIVLFVSANVKGDQERPNILVIITDQHSSAQMTQRGYPYVNTPGIDKLASEGITFTRAYTTYPVCRRARLSLFTGRMGSQAKEGIDDTYTSLLRTKAKYETAYFGKWHVGMSKIGKKNWHKLHTAGLQHNDTKTQGMATRFLERYAQRRRRRNLLAKEIGEDEVGPSRPFLLVASFLNPHDCVEMARRISGGRPEDGIAFSDEPINYKQDVSLCPPLPSNFDVPPNVTQAFAIRRGAEYGEHEWLKLPTKYWTTTQWRQYIYGYDRLVEQVDAHILALRTKLEQLDLLNDTVIVFLSDHGSGRGSHQWTAKQTFYEESVGVPFILSWKGHMLQEPGYIDNNTLVSTGMDLFPTLLSLGKVDLPKDHAVGGEDLTKMAFATKRTKAIVRDNNNVRGPSPRRPFVVSEFDVRGTKGPDLIGRMLVTDPSLSPHGRRLKYMLFDGGAYREQLFDLDADPGELSPVVMDPSYRDDLLACRRALRQWVEETNDGFVVTFPS